MDDQFEFEDEFDFGLWCPVCDRAIEHPPTPSPSDSTQPIASTSKAAPPPSAPSVTSAAAAAPKVKRRDSAHGSKPSLAHRRNKSGTKLHTRGKSHTSLHALTSTTALKPNTSIVSPPASPALPAETATAADAGPAPEGESLKPPSALYCSEECRRVDEMRSRLAFAHLGPNAPPLVGMYNQHSSSHSSPAIAHAPSHSHSSMAGAGGGGAPPMARAGSSNTNLDFSTRRMSSSTRSTSAFSAMRTMTPIPPPLSPAPGAAAAAYAGGSPLLSPALRPTLLARHHSDFAHPPTGHWRDQSPAPDASTSARSSSAKGKHREFVGSPSSLRSPTLLQHAQHRSLSGGGGDSRSSSGGMMVGSLPVTRHSIHSQSQSQGHFDLPALTPVITHEPPTARKPARSSSSASLALMGSSLGRSYGGERSPWLAMRAQRSESTASLSGLVANGQMSFPHDIDLTTSNSPSPHSSQQLEREGTAIPTGGRRGPSPDSEEEHAPDCSTSASSFAHSHASSSRASSHRNSTAGSSAGEHGGSGKGYLSSSAGSSRAQRRSSGEKVRRPTQALMMTPSASSLSGAGSSYGEQNGKLFLAGGGTNESTPTQSLSKASSGGSLAQRPGRSQHMASSPSPPLLQQQQHRSRSGTRRAHHNGAHRSTSRTAVNGDDEGPMDPPSLTARRSSSRGTGGIPHSAGSTIGRSNSSRLSQHHNPIVGSPPVNAAVSNPALAYLAPPSQPALQKTWSWDHIPDVKTYGAMDADKLKIGGAGTAQSAQAGQGAVGAGGGVKKERKRLFHFQQEDDWAE